MASSKNLSLPASNSLIQPLSRLLSQTLLLLVSTLCTTAVQSEESTRNIPREQAIKQYATTDSQFVDLDGVNVHYRVAGKGPAVLLVHGTLGDTTDWDGWASQLQTDFRVIRFDMPGFGLTGDMPNDNYSVDRMLSLIDSLMDYLGEEQFAIVGISYGGMVGFRYAATRTERITAMVLINSAGIQTGKAAPKKDQSDTQPRKNIFADPIVYAADIKNFYSGYINDSAQITESLIARKTTFINIENRDHIGRIARGLYERGNPQRVLSHVRAPSLILWGTANNALDTETAQTFVDTLNNSCQVEMQTFADGGHYINIGRPIESAKPAVDFLQRMLGGKRPADCNVVCPKPVK